VYIYTQTPEKVPEIDPVHREMLLLVNFALLYAAWCSLEGNTRENRAEVLASEVIPSTYRTSLLVQVQLLLPMT
jgi:hypothetical protein